MHVYKLDHIHPQILLQFPMLRLLSIAASSVYSLQFLTCHCSFFLLEVIFMDMKWYIVVLICISLMINDASDHFPAPTTILNLWGNVF